MIASFRQWLPAVSTAFLLATPVLLNASEIYVTDGVAINGYDPVAYCREHKPVKGGGRFTASHQGAKFHFSSQSNRDAFLRSPDRYAPQYGGYCAYGLVRGYKATTQPHAFTIVDDKLPALVKSPSDIQRLPSLAMGRPRLDYSWQLQIADGQKATMSHSPRLVTDDMSALRKAALQGGGIVQLPTIYICDDIDAGRLINVLPDWSPEPGIVRAIFPSRRGLLPSVRALVDFLARGCAIQRVAANKIVPPPTKFA